MYFNFGRLRAMGYKKAKPIPLWSLVLTILIPLFSEAQDAPYWQKLATAPVAPGGRHEDGWFTGVNKGWIVNLKGEIWHTPDAGFSWLLQEKFAGTYLRCVTFADSLHGWAGSIGIASPADTIPLYQTSDGGTSWSAVTTINGPKPPGLCGMWAVNISMPPAALRGPPISSPPMTAAKPGFHRI